MALTAPSYAPTSRICSTSIERFHAPSSCARTPNGLTLGARAVEARGAIRSPVAVASLVPCGFMLAVPRLRFRASSRLPRDILYVYQSQTGTF